MAKKTYKYEVKKKFAFEELPIFESLGNRGAVISRKSRG